MKKLILTLFTATLFQTPAFAEAPFSNFEIYNYGKIRGILFCNALKAGAKNIPDIARFKDMLNNPDINLAERVYDLSNDAQKKYFFNGWMVYTHDNCPNEMKRLRESR